MNSEREGSWASDAAVVGALIIVLTEVLYFAAGRAGLGYYPVSAHWATYLLAGAGLLAYVARRKGWWGR